MKSCLEYEAGYYRESLLIWVCNAFKTTTETEVRTKIMVMRSFCMYSPFKKGSQCELRKGRVNKFLTNLNFWSMLRLTNIGLTSNCASVMKLYQERKGIM
jgi:hypothetical protein